MNFEQILKLNKQNKILKLKQHQNESEIAELLHNQKYHQMQYISSFLDDSHAELIGKQFIHFNSLINLKVLFLQKQLNSFHSISVFGQNLKYLSNLSYLQISICQNVIQDQSTELSEIGVGLSHLKQLKYFNLELQEASKLGKQGAKAIRKGLQDLNQLENLFYRLNFNNKENDLEILQQLCKGFKYYKNLKHLRILLLNGLKIQDEGFSHVLIKLKYLQSLEIFSTAVSHQSMSFSNEIEQFKESIPQLKNLKHITFEIRSRLIQNINKLQQLQETLFDLQNLEELFIELNVELNEGENYYFGKNIKSNSQLKNLSVYINNRQTKQNNIILDKDVENLKNLKEFKFYVENLQINEQSAQNLAEILNNNLNIEDQLIYFQNEIPVDCILMIGKNLGKLQKLKKLHLQIFQLESKNIEGLQQCLVNELSKLSSLEELILCVHFNDSNKEKESPLSIHNLVNLKRFCYYEYASTTDCFSIIGNSLKQFVNLQNLELNLKHYDDKKLIQLLIDGLQYLTNLKLLLLQDSNVWRDAKIKNKHLLKLFLAISKVQNLVELDFSLNLDEDSEDIKDIIFQISQIISSMKQLRVLNFGNKEKTEEDPYNIHLYLKRKMPIMVKLQ